MITLTGGDCRESVVVAVSVSVPLFSQGPPVLPALGEKYQDISEHNNNHTFSSHHTSHMDTELGKNN